MEREWNMAGGMALVLGLAMAAGLAGCGGETDAVSVAGSSRSESVTPKTDGPLDPVQDQLTGAMDQVFAAGPDQLAVAGPCLTDSVVAATDVPDAFLVAGEGVAAGEDPAAAFEGAAGSAQASLMQFAESTQQALMALAGTGSCEAEATKAPTPVPGNPLSGTPFEPVGAALEDLVAGLATGGTDDDPNLKPLARAASPALSGLVTAFGLLPQEVRDAPVLGPVLATLQQAARDLAVLLPAAADYDAPATTEATKTMLGNAMRNVLLGVVPVAQIDEATGQDVSGQIESGIAQAEAALGDGLGQVITPLFDEVLDGALAPALDPVEALLAEVLGQIDDVPLGAILAGL